LPKALRQKNPSVFAEGITLENFNGFQKYNAVLCHDPGQNKGGLLFLDD